MSGGRGGEWREKNTVSVTLSIGVSEKKNLGLFSQRKLHLRAAEKKPTRKKTLKKFSAEKNPLCENEDVRFSCLAPQSKIRSQKSERS